MLFPPQRSLPLGRLMCAPSSSSKRQAASTHYFITPFPSQNFPQLQCDDEAWWLLPISYFLIIDGFWLGWCLAFVILLATRIVLAVA